MFRLLRIVEDEMTGEEVFVMVGNGKTLTMQELSAFKQKYRRHLDHFSVRAPNGEEIEWEDIP